MRVNRAPRIPAPETHEGATAARIPPIMQLRRSVMACMLWEDTFYESGEEIAKRITSLVTGLKFEDVASIAIEARERMKLRHVPLLLARELARRKEGRKMGDLLQKIIQRPDELTEFLSIYWKEKRQPLAKQVKIGLARAFRKFNEYSLAKYNQDNPVKLRDVLFLSHAKPKDEAQDALWKKLVNKTLAVPDTWEVALSGGADKKATFERLMDESNLGALAFLRNLRNMKQASVDESKVIQYSEKVDLAKVLPFRFIAAARACPKWEHIIEPMMLRALEKIEKLPGKTILVVDNSGSMYGTKVSHKSEIDRADAAHALAILLREICEGIRIISFSDTAKFVAPRRGFALAECIKSATQVSGTNTDTALGVAEHEGYDRIIVITDEQSHQTIRAPLPESKAYFVNVAPYAHGIGYGKWIHVDGWSEAIVDYIRAYEQE